jgi:nicotinamidase-related amidase
MQSDHRYTQPDLEHSALILIDVQNDFTLHDAPARIEGTLEIIPNLIGLLTMYRTRHLPIIHVVRLYRPDGSNVDVCRRSLIESGARIVAPGSEGAELVAELKPSLQVRLDADLLLNGDLQNISEQEYIVYKPRWGAFYGTGLEAFLRSIQVDTLVFAGCNFPNCPRTSIYEASERDFRLVVIRDALSGLYQRGEEEMEKIAVKILSVAELGAMFADAQGQLT